MSDLLFCDSFDHYDKDTKYAKYNTTDSNLIAGTAARYLGSGLAQANGASTLITFPENVTTIYAGAAYYISTATAVGPTRLHQFSDSGQIQVYLQVEIDGRVNLYRGNGSVLINSVYAMHTGVWYYVELQTTFGTAGSAEIKINEVTVGSASGINTIVSTNSYCTAAQVCGQLTFGIGMSIDDYYVHKTAFLGDVKIGIIKPDSAGVASSWTLSTGTSTYTADWQLLREVPADGDATYIYTSNTGDETIVNFEDVDLEGGTCPGIQLLHFTKKTNANVRKVKHRVRTHATNYDGPEESVTDAYKYWRWTLTTNPNTGSAWTDAELDAIQYGVKMTL